MDANTASQYQVSTWGKSLTEDLVLPSDPSSKIKVKRLDLAGLVKSGLIDEIDQLGAIMDDEVVAPAKGKRPTDRQKKKPTKAEAAAAEEAKIAQVLRGGTGEFETMIRLMGRMIPVVVLAPEVTSPYERHEAKGKVEWKVIPDEDRETDLIYADTLPLQDQIFLMTWAMEGMNMQELEQFRKQRDSSVGDVADESSVPDEAE